MSKDGCDNEKNNKSDQLRKQMRENDESELKHN